MDDRALSLVQPWLSAAILKFGKRIENRAWNHGCAYRGPIWLHASLTKGRAFDESVEGIQSAMEAMQRGDEWMAWKDGHIDFAHYMKHGRCAPLPSLPMGAIVGRASIVDVIANADDFDRWSNEGRDVSKGVATERRAQRVWWFGGFALVLDNVVEIEPVPAKGALGLWRVPEQIAADAHAALRLARARR